jgi:hypothetical protein
MNSRTMWLIGILAVIVAVAVFWTFSSVRQIPTEMDAQTSPVDEDITPPNTTGPDENPPNAS